MAWCEENGVDYIFGLAGNRRLHALAEPVADDLKVRRAEAGAETMRAFADLDYAAGSWNRTRRVVCRMEATRRGFDARYVVTSLPGEAKDLYEAVYCIRGQAENLIKLHKAQLASDRTSCQSPIANQVRLILHTAAYWLMLALRDAVPAKNPLATAEFATLRLRLLKIGARIVEKAARVRIHLASRLSRRRPVHRRRRTPQSRRTVKNGATCPDKTRNLNLKRPSKQRRNLASRRRSRS